jgi:hypothetical protein
MKPETAILLQDCDPLKKGWLNAYDEADKSRPIQLRFRSYNDGTAWASAKDNNSRQTWEFFFKPVSDGIEIWMKLATEEPVPGAIAVQQCLRFSGETNQAWRKAIACMPFLSEFELQAQGSPNETLSFYRKDGHWVKVPVQHTTVQTLHGAPPFGGNAMDVADNGLIIRESKNRQWASGMYWERTAYLANRFPADCLHSAVEFGPLQAGKSRTVKGKFYLMEANKEELLNHWQADFQMELPTSQNLIQAEAAQ